MFDTVAKSFEDYSGVVSIVGHELFLVEQTTVAFVKLFRQIPVEESHKGHDAIGDQIVGKLHVEVKAFLVDWIVSAPKRDDT